MPLTDKQLESIPYKVGDIVDYHDHTNNRISKGCDVTFISREYIVICIHRELKTPEEAEHAVSKWREVKILVYKDYWHTIIPSTPCQEKSNSQSTKTTSSSSYVTHAQASTGHIKMQ